MTYEVSATFDAAHRRHIVGGEPMIFHCHHYNLFLRQTLHDADFIDMRPIEKAAASSVAYAQLDALVRETPALSTPEARLAAASALFTWAGFGTLDVDGITQAGGVVEAPSSHYAVGHRARSAYAATEPVCEFVCGFIAGALARAFDAPDGSYSVVEVACAAVEDGPCRFEVERIEPGSALAFPTPSLGPLTEHEPIGRCATHVDYDGILAAVGGLPLVGNQEGLIPAFGVVLTRHFANYYNRISFEFLRRVGERFGEEGREAATDLLVEAGRVCAFNTFGGIMTSTEWDALIRPTLTSSADWVHGMVAVVEAFGWGRWHLTAVDEDEAEFVIQDDYESVGWLSAYGPAEGNVAFLHQGGVEGLMNLVHLAQIADKPTLDQRLYDRVFRDPSGFRAECTASRAAGAAFTRFRVRRRG